MHLRLVSLLLILIAFLIPMLLTPKPSIYSFLISARVSFNWINFFHSLENIQDVTGVWFITSVSLWKCQHSDLLVFSCEHLNFHCVATFWLLALSRPVLSVWNKNICTLTNSMSSWSTPVWLTLIHCKKIPFRVEQAYFRTSWLINIHELSCFYRNSHEYWCLNVNIFCKNER